MSKEIFSGGTPFGAGFSFSSARAVLNATRDLFFRTSKIPAMDDVAKLALATEEANAGYPLAANDVTPIVYGGLLTVRTLAATRDVQFDRIPCDISLLEEHIVLAWDRKEPPHHASDVLQSVVGDSRAPELIRTISQLAEKAADALSHGNLSLIAECLTQYRTLFFDEWGCGKLTHPRATGMIEAIQSKFGSALLSWKPPGAGSAASLGILTTEPAAMIEFLTTSGWTAIPLSVSDGLRCREKSDGQIFSCPGRFDIVGAADLGMGLGIDGCCVSVAVAPRNSLVLQPQMI